MMVDGRWLGWMVTDRFIARDFLQMVFVEIQNKIACSITHICHLRFLAQKLARFRTSLPKKYFSFIPCYSDVFCWHVFFFILVRSTVKNIQKNRPGKEWQLASEPRRWEAEVESHHAPNVSRVVSRLLVLHGTLGQQSHGNFDVALGQVEGKP